MKGISTLEMLNLTKGTNKVFRDNDLEYSELTGFVSKNDGIKWSGHAFKYLNDFIELNRWKEVVEPVDIYTALKDCEETGQKYQGEKYSTDRIAQDHQGKVYAYTLDKNSNGIYVQQMWIPVD